MAICYNNIIMRPENTSAQPPDPIDEILIKYKGRPAEAILPSEKQQLQFLQAVHNCDLPGLTKATADFEVLIAAAASTYKRPDRDSQAILRTAFFGLIYTAQSFPRHESDDLIDCGVDLMQQALATQYLEADDRPRTLKRGTKALLNLIELGEEAASPKVNDQTQQEVAQKTARKQRLGKQATQQAQKAEQAETRKAARLADKARREKEIAAAKEAARVKREAEWAAARAATEAKKQQRHLEFQAKLASLSPTQEIIQPLLATMTDGDMAKHVAEESNMLVDEAKKAVEAAIKRFKYRMEGKFITRSMLVLDMYRTGYQFEVQPPPKPLSELLTASEIELLPHIHLPSNNIAKELNITPKAVQTKVDKIINKSCARSRAEVALMVVIFGINRTTAIETTEKTDN